MTEDITPSVPEQNPPEQKVTVPPTADDKNLAMLAHLLGIVMGFVGALIIWLINKDKPERAFANDQAKESLNFQITVMIAYFVAGALAWLLIGFALIPIIWLANLIFCIIAAVAASNGKNYRYPLSIRLVK